MSTSRKTTRVQWLKLGLTAFAFLFVGLVLGFALQVLLKSVSIPTDVPVWIAMALIFAILGAVNISLVPLPFGISIMVAASAHWNLVLVALVGSAGASLGEFSGYFFGYIGKRVAVKDDDPGYQMMHRWIKKYGLWAIALLSFQPILPFEVGGFIAGIARMPIARFIFAIWLGKFPKYLLLIMLGNKLVQFLPWK